MGLTIRLNSSRFVRYFTNPPIHIVAVHAPTNMNTKGADIDEETYDRILGCMLTGSCSHVMMVPREYTRDTRIQALHIAAAANTVLQLKYFYYSCSDFKSALFQLYPEQVAMCHENLNFVKEYVDYKNYKSKLKDTDLEFVGTVMQPRLEFPETYTRYCLSTYWKQKPV